MTHNEIYTKFMIEYDKATVTSSYPSLTEYEVATVLDKAYHALIAQKVTGNNVRRAMFEADLKAIEDLSPLVVQKQIDFSSAPSVAPNVVKSELPSEHLYLVELYFKYQMASENKDVLFYTVADSEGAVLSLDRLNDAWDYLYKKALKKDAVDESSKFYIDEQRVDTINGTVNYQVVMKTAHQDYVQSNVEFRQSVGAYAGWRLTQDDLDTIDSQLSERGKSRDDVAIAIHNTETGDLEMNNIRTSAYWRYSSTKGANLKVTPYIGTFGEMRNIIDADAVDGYSFVTLEVYDNEATWQKYVYNGVQLIDLTGTSLSGGGIGKGTIIRDEDKASAAVTHYMTMMIATGDVYYTQTEQSRNTAFTAHTLQEINDVLTNLPLQSDKNLGYTEVVLETMCLNMPAGSKFEVINYKSKAYDNKTVRMLPVKLVNHAVATKFFTSAFNMPWIKIPVMYIESENIYVVYDLLNPPIMNNATIIYIRKPNPFAKDLSSVDHSYDISYFNCNDNELDSTKALFEFECNETVAEELISLAVAFALENVESQRLNSKLNMRGLEA